MNERKLVEGILECDPKAQSVFFSKYRERLYRMCVSFLGVEDREAEDIVQEVFLIAFKQLPDFDFRYKLISWLTQICVNLCYARLRERKRMILMLEQDLERIAGTTLEEVARASEQRQKEERISLLRRLVEGLGRTCREIITLRDWEGRSYVEISRALKVPIGTVMSRLHRCRAALKELAQAAIQEPT